MSEHSVEELKRQWQQAEDRAKTANSAAYAAKRRYIEGCLDASGLRGHKAQAKNWRGNAEVFVVKGVKANWNGTVLAVGNLLKKDGTAGLRTVTHSLDNLTDLGPYEATP